MQQNLKQDPAIKELAETVKTLQEQPRVHRMVEERMQEFRQVHTMDSRKWHEELVYCLLTAYSSALLGQRCLDALCCDGTLVEGSLEDIKGCLTEEGHRFANRRAEYIYNTRHLQDTIKKTIQEFPDSRAARAWLVDEVKGIGWKESSHYLRNVGYFDLAILDRHILRNMADHGLVDPEEAKKGLTKKRYLRYEAVLDRVGAVLDMPLGEMDLYLWYRKTGKVLK